MVFLFINHRVFTVFLLKMVTLYHHIKFDD